MTELSRRTALTALGLAGAGAAAAPLLGSSPASAAPAPASTVAPHLPAVSTVPVEGLHLTFGADPARSMTVSWLTASRVANPRVYYGTMDGGFGAVVAAQTVTYTDGTSGRVVWVHHALLEKLRPNSTYVYAAQHDGASPDSGSFRTAPTGRSAFTFTSFGDQATPEVTWIADGTVGLDANSSPAAKDTVAGIEQVGPLFHLLNGDLCYANLDVDRVRTWSNFFANNTRSARHRPWMPAAGNHEIEKRNGVLGFDAYKTYFQVPGSDSSDELAGLYYAFTVGSVRVITLQNDDYCLQDGSDYYVRGYSDGAQLRWLERELKTARASRQIDWIVVCMHQVMISSADFNGADLGLRAAYGPLFDQYSVDLVVCGHEHDYERSLAVRGVVSGSETLTPDPASTATDDIDTSLGTVHMVLGGGGVSGTSNQFFFQDGTAKVITAVSKKRVNGHRQSTFVKEEAIWSAVRDADHPYGFAAFTVDPGTKPGGRTTLHVTYYNVNKPHGNLTVFERFTLHRNRSDG